MSKATFHNELYQKGRAQGKKEERERCAEICDAIGKHYLENHILRKMVADECAEAIRKG